MSRLTDKRLKVACDYFVHFASKEEAVKYRMLAESAPKYEEIYRKLADYEDKEEQGLLIELPCKVGDTVYTACSWGIESGVVGSIEIISDKIFVNNKHGAMIGEAHNIFLTREEALAKMGGK